MNFVKGHMAKASGILCCGKLKLDNTTEGNFKPAHMLHISYLSLEKLSKLTTLTQPIQECKIIFIIKPHKFDHIRS